MLGNKGSKSKGNDFQDIYRLLLDFFGPQGWWPGDTSVEIVVGAVLTQNTNWGNVEKAIANLISYNMLSVEALLAADTDELAFLIKPSGYFNVKAKRLKNLFSMIAERYGGNLTLLLGDNLNSAREALLSVKGVGPETADAILLYAGKHPIFVVDAYTYRIFSRHQLVDEETDYQTIQETFMANIVEDAALFSEYHALIVQLGKQYCKKSKPVCLGCPLEKI